MAPQDKLPEPNYNPLDEPAYDRRHVEDLQRDIPNKHLRCVQCFGEPDGAERLLPPRGGGAPVLLHEQCWQFYNPERGT
jgi:hypothetical protein